MELHDICDGCSQHPAHCVCSVSIGPERASSHRPRPAKMADKLRIIARDAQHKEIQVKTQRLADQLRWRATQAAKTGKLSLSIWLSELGISKPVGTVIAEELERDGFKCSITTETVAYYSNTDWDDDDLLFISWE